MPFSGTQNWDQVQQNQQGNQNPFHSSNQLNPSVPGFQPQGNEMLYYQARPPTPPISEAATPASMLHMRQLILETHFNNTKDVVGLERKARENSEAIKTTQEVVGRDMRVLQSQLQDLKDQIEAREQQTGVVTRPSRANQVVAPPKQWTHQFGKDRVAEAYLEQADNHEKTAIKLRDEAKEISTGVSRKLVTLKMIGGSDGRTRKKAKVEFACCGSEFGSTQEMLEHVTAKHGSDAETEEAVDDVELNGRSDETPTHVPLRRVRVEKCEKPSHAVDIKAPGGEQENPAGNTATQKKIEVKEDAVHEDRPVMTRVESKFTAVASRSPTMDAGNGEMWQPLAVRQMPSSHSVDPMNAETFTWEFLHYNLGGFHWSPGYYFIQHNSILPSKAYWILEAEYEPYLPSEPGQHGAKLTAFFNSTLSEHGKAPDETNYLDTPVFIRREGAKEYIYFGNYSQLRFSDKLDHDRVIDHVPEKVRQYWADQLAGPRPDWVTKCLMEHFWPKPTYCGPIPTDSALNTPATEETAETATSAVLEKRVTRALARYAIELKDWEKETRMKVSHLKAEHIVAAFANADAAAEPGLRLWWEYLQCVRYDQKFYEFLVALKHNVRLQVPAAGVVQGHRHNGSGGTGQPGGEKSVQKYSSQQLEPIGRKTVKPAASNGVEAVRPAPVPGTARQTDVQHPCPTKPAGKLQSNAKNGTKPHTGGQRPWEKGTQGLQDRAKVDELTKPPVGPEKEKDDLSDQRLMLDGDMDVAKQLQKDFKNGGRHHSGKRSGGAPPHLRGRQE